MSQILINALKKIEQMSDTGSYEKTIVEMKSIATNALALPPSVEVSAEDFYKMKKDDKFNPARTAPDVYSAHDMIDFAESYASQFKTAK